MEKYTIYCTKEQTKKAWELGAPIKVQQYVGGQLCENWFVVDNACYHKPTSEQMIGWLEEEYNIHIDIFYRCFCYDWGIRDHYDIVTEQTMRAKSLKDVLLRAVGFALDYLIRNK